MNIRANNVSLSINGRRILSNVTLLAEGGKMTALTGKSGSGKTTLLNCLGLIHPIDSGKIFVDNNDVTGWIKPSSFRVEKSSDWELQEQF